MAEHHKSQGYREAFNQIIQSTPDMNCVFLEDSPEMDAAAGAYLRGEGTFESTYLARFYEVNRVMGYKDDEIAAFWSSNYAGREAILRTAKERNLKVFHVDYSSSESRGHQVVTNDNSSTEWNYIRRHEIMTRNIARHQEQCPKSAYLVGESHLDPERILKMRVAYAESKNDCFNYTGPDLRSLDHHLDAAGFETKSINVILRENPRSTPEILNTQDLTPERVRTLQNEELRLSDPYYLMFNVPVNLKEEFDQVYLY